MLSSKKQQQETDAVDKLGELQRKAFRLTSAVAPSGIASINNEPQQQQMNVHLGPLTQPTSNQAHSITGQLFVALKFVPENQELISSRSTRDTSGELHVIVKEARNIGGFEALQLSSLSKNSNGQLSAGQLTSKPPRGPLPNPFCKCYLLDSNGHRIGKQKTPHLKRTANPRWDFKCVFNAVRLSQLTCQAIEILMFNRDSILVSNDDYLGGIRLCQSSQTSGSEQEAGLANSAEESSVKSNGAQDEPLCSERESRLWGQMLTRPNIWVYGELRLRRLRPLVTTSNLN